MARGLKHEEETPNRNACREMAWLAAVNGVKQIHIKGTPAVMADHVTVMQSGSLLRVQACTLQGCTHRRLLCCITIF
jgi:hypothetical protein